ncbi:hypothetical protein GQ457_03G018210 [Hibiscus cannabinus]
MGLGCDADLRSALTRLAGTYAQWDTVNAMIRYRSGEPYLGVRLEDSFMSRIYEARAMCGHICMCLKYSFGSFVLLSFSKLTLFFYHCRLKEFIEVQYVDIRDGSFLNDTCGVRY